MHWFGKLRWVWLSLSLIALAVAQFVFTGDRTSEVAGNLTFLMLVLCAPASLLGYFGMFLLFDFFQTYGLFPYNSRLALSAVWGVYFLAGFVQWFSLPIIWKRRKPNIGA